MTFEVMLNLIQGDNYSRYRYLTKQIFFKSGRMRAVLSDLGIIVSRNDMLTISVIMGTNLACIPSGAR